MKNYNKQPNDQEKAEVAVELLVGLIEKHQKTIHPTLWVGAMIETIAINFKKSGHSRQPFTAEMFNATKFYFSQWNELPEKED